MILSDPILAGRNHARVIAESLARVIAAIESLGFVGGHISPLTTQNFPVLLFLGVFVSLVFFLLGFSLVPLSVFCLFSRIFKGSPSEENPWCFEVLLGIFEKTKEKKDRVGPRRPWRVAPRFESRLAFVDVVIVPRGTAEWLARVHSVR